MKKAFARLFCFLFVVLLCGSMAVTAFAEDNGESVINQVMRKNFNTANVLNLGWDICVPEPLDQFFPDFSYIPGKPTEDSIINSYHLYYKDYYEASDRGFLRSYTTLRKIGFDIGDGHKELNETTYKSLVNQLLQMGYTTGEDSTQAAIKEEHNTYTAEAEKSWYASTPAYEYEVTSYTFTGYLQETEKGLVRFADRDFAYVKVEVACRKTDIPERVTTFENGEKAGETTVRPAESYCIGEFRFSFVFCHSADNRIASTSPTTTVNAIDIPILERQLTKGTDINPNDSKIPSEENPGGMPQAYDPDKEYKAGDIVLVGGIIFVLVMVCGVPVWVRVPTPIAETPPSPCEEQKPEKEPEKEVDLSRYGYTKDSEGNWRRELAKKEGEMRHEMIYDPTGKPIGEYRAGYDGSYTTSEIRTDEAGNITEIVDNHCGPDGKMSYTHRQYDESGRLTSEHIYDENLKLREQRQYSSREHLSGDTVGDAEVMNQRIVESQKYDGSGNPIGGKDTNVLQSDSVMELDESFVDEFKNDKLTDLLRDNTGVGRGK